MEVSYREKNMDYEMLANQIIELIGGLENIDQVWNCTTRLRFKLNDDSLVQDEKIKKLNGVLGTQERNDQYQIIIGNDVEEVEKILEQRIGKKETLTDSKNIQKEKKRKENIFNEIIDAISNIFSPILPAIIGAGMMKCILSILTLTKIVSPNSGVYIVFYMISDAAFYFLPFLVAVSASRRFHLNEFIGLSAAGVLLYPTLINGAAKHLPPINFLGLKIPYLGYSSSVVPIILVVWLMSFVYKYVDRYMPKVLRFILTPVITMIITIPIGLFALAPLGNYLGELLSTILDWLFTYAGPVAGFVLAGLNPLIIMTGMHYAIMPIAIQNLARTGYDNFWLPFALISNIAQAGALFALGFKFRKSEDKSIAFSTCVSAILGVTEPGLFGVNLKLKKPLYAAMAAGGVGGLIAVLMGVRTYSFSAPNILILPTYIAPNGSLQGLIAIMVALIVTFILAFGMTVVLKIDRLNPETITGEQVNNDAKNDEITVNNATVSKDELIYSPIEGELQDIKQVPDSTFSDEIIGKGIAIFPRKGMVFAPFDGQITMVFRTKHALAFTSKTGVEVLVHIGIDTVELDGRGFKLLKSKGDNVKKGEPVLEFDRDLIKKQGYQLITPVVVTNYQKFKNVEKISGLKQVDSHKVVMRIEE
ncbi:PTS beta-glucoside transporter subunit EIIBCA [Lactobacillus kullabergensis]|nr:PTS beta-glucoside transporter subunit EIIBCA [Lactobacillus kullabergensis]